MAWEVVLDYHSAISFALLQIAVKVHFDRLFGLKVRTKPICVFEYLSLEKMFSKVSLMFAEYLRRSNIGREHSYELV